METRINSSVLISHPTPTPPPFLWGVATSGFQSEGGYNGENQPQNNWAWAEERGDAARSGRSANFWETAQDDFVQCRALGLNAFRLSIEWARVQPCTELNAPSVRRPEPPPFDHAALDRYAQMIVDCRAAGLEPILTWQHFTHPAWLGQDAWIYPATIEYFATYVRYAATYLREALQGRCAMPRYHITVNEPVLLASNHYLYRIFPSGFHFGLNPTILCLSHLLQAHARAYQILHDLLGDIEPMVSFNNYCSDLYWSDAAWVDLFFCPQEKVDRQHVLTHLKEKARHYDAAFVESKIISRRSGRYWLGQGLKKIHYYFSEVLVRHPAWQRLLDLIYASPQPLLDFLAMDYYDPFVAHAFRFPHWGDYEPRRRSFRDWVLEAIASKWWDWRALPKGLGFFVHNFSQYHLPILIAENGMAQRRPVDRAEPLHRRDKMARSVHLREHVRMVMKLKEKGYPLIGYMHWSLFDNYEWGSYTPRFGLYSIDFNNGLTRQAVDPFGDNPSETYRAEIAAAREKCHEL
jgi:beta-glucosidase/6-phospho-beta-glucosidase/beta-galactosidase